MTPFDPNIDATFGNYADLLLRRHHLLAEGKDDTPETREIEDRLTELWDNLDDVQRKSLNGIGSDLNWARRKGELPPKGRKEADVTEDDHERLNEALSVEQWHRVLHYLRICAAQFSPELLADMRAAAYDQISLIRMGSVFHDLAAELTSAGKIMPLRQS